MDYFLVRLIFSLDFPLRSEEMNYSCETVINVRFATWNKVNIKNLGVQGFLSGCNTKAKMTPLPKLK